MEDQANPELIYMVQVQQQHAKINKKICHQIHMIRPTRRRSCNRLHWPARFLDAPRLKFLSRVLSSGSVSKSEDCQSRLPRFVLPSPVTNNVTKLRNLINPPRLNWFSCSNSNKQTTTVTRLVWLPTSFSATKLCKVWLRCDTSVAKLVREPRNWFWCNCEHQPNTGSWTYCGVTRSWKTLGHD